MSLMVSLTYLPFLGERLVRTAGDEKVYIAQALEMAQNGTWFLQSLGGVPDYYKGPAHYVLIQLGLKIFGFSLWTVLYMNFVCVLLGAVAVAEVVRQIYPQKRYWAFWAGSFFALNVGVSGHLFTSQMEAELTGFFALGFLMLWRSKDWKGDILFWLVAALAGWFKSPVHSVLMGVSAILFWLATGEAWKRIKDYRSWVVAFLGILVGAAGYAPALILDRENFLRLYLEKETFKNPNGGPWWQALVPMISYYLIPWMALAFVAYIETLSSFLKKYRKKVRSILPSEQRFLLLSLAGIFPTMTFFTYYYYRGENYALPVVSSFVFLIFFLLHRTEGLFPKVRSTLIWLGSAFVLPVVAFMTAMYFRFQVDSGWWSVWVLPLVWFLSLGVFVGLFVDYRKKENGLGFGVTFSKVCVVLILNLILFVFGKMEVYQLQEKVRADRRAGETYNITYWNLNRLIWNESGLMSVSIGEPIKALYHESDLLRAIRSGDLILGRDTDVGKEIIALAKKNYPDLEPETHRWDRWKTHAADGAGNSLVLQAWKSKDLSILFDHALILRFKQRPMN